MLPKCAWDSNPGPKDFRCRQITELWWPHFNLSVKASYILACMRRGFESRRHL